MQKINYWWSIGIRLYFKKIMSIYRPVLFFVFCFFSSRSAHVNLKKTLWIFPSVHPTSVMFSDPHPAVHRPFLLCPFIHFPSALRCLPTGRKEEYGRGGAGSDSDADKCRAYQYCGSTRLNHCTHFRCFSHVAVTVWCLLFSSKGWKHI